MSAEFEVSGTDVIVRFEYTAPIVTAQKAITDAAHYLWDHGYGNHGTEEEPILFSSLSNQDKLNIVSTHLKTVIIDAARTYDAINYKESYEYDSSIHDLG